MSRLPRRMLSLLLFTGTLCAENAVEEFSWVDLDHTLNRYCYECHGGFATDADLDLVNIDQRADIASNPERWSTVVHALRTHYMPHPDGREMASERRQKLIEKIRSELAVLAADYAPTSASLRRLNRTEYQNTLNDLFLVDGDWAGSLPADDAGYGFDNNAASLTFSSLLMERYFEIAARVSMVAVPQKLAGDEWMFPAAIFSGGNLRGQSLTIVASGKAHAARQRIFFPANGRYDLTLKLSADQAGDEKARAQLWLAGSKLSEHVVHAGRKDSPEEFTQSVRIQTPGEYEVEVRFANDFYEATETGKADRNLIVHGARLQGPQQSPEDLQSPFLDRHFGSIPEGLSRKQVKDGILRFASRAYRRPITPEETQSLWKVFQANDGSYTQDWDVRNGLYAVVDAVLTSPSFLFRFEGRTETEDDFALASWLSYFLWSSMPDDQLFDLALRGQLRSNLESEVARMLADPRAVVLAENFVGQWWRLRDLEIHKPDSAVYAGASRELLDAMREETQRFFMHVMENDRPLLDILSADYTFLNEALAQHYGIEGVKGPHFRKVSIKDTPRRGVWSHGGILTVTSYPNHTSPVLRGQWILENLIGLAPPPPPDNIPSLPGTDGKPAPEDLRASLAQHREISDCASCHDIMDPFGLALEHFDGVGGLRELEERKKLSEETLFDGSVIRDPVDLARYFEEQRSADFVDNVARKLAIYAAGRGLNWQDRAALQRVTSETREGDFRFSSLVQAIVIEFAPIQKQVSLVKH